MTKYILETERLRRVPQQFSWVDHRLVRHHYLPRARAQSWGLYLLLVTVSDENGLSYYSDQALARLLSLSLEGLLVARTELLHAGVIAYESPLYQVLGLDAGKELS